MNIALLSTSDTTGGAAVVSKRLADALCAEGHRATLVVLNRRSDADNVVRAGNGVLWSRRAFYGERLGIFARNGFNRADLFKVSTASTGIDVSRLPAVREADAIMPGWVNQGFLSLKEMNRLALMGKPVIWTMHDMWCFTGICHLSGSCTRYRNHCGECWLLHGARGPHDLSFRTWRRKKALYDAHDNIRFVAVSNWLRDRATESSLLGDRQVEVIPNPLIIPQTPHLNPEVRQPVIVMGAARLDDDVKNLPLAVEALNHVWNDGDNPYSGVKAVFFGTLRNPDILKALKMPHEWLGSLGSRQVTEVFNNSRVVLSTSRFEMLPTTIVEGLAWGCVAVATSTGGQCDIIEEGRNGFLAASGDAGSVATAIRQALDSNVQAQALRDSVAAKFAPTVIARKYLELIDRCR